MNRKDEKINGWSISQGDYVHNGRYDKEADRKKMRRLQKQYIFVVAAGIVVVATVLLAVYLR